MNALPLPGPDLADDLDPALGRPFWQPDRTITPERLAQLVAEQSGLVTRAQARSAGLSERAVDWRLRRGRWVRVHPGVYQTVPGRTDWHTRVVAAQLAAGPGAALVLAGAAYQWGLIRQQPRLVTLGVPHSRKPARLDGVQLVRMRHLDEHVDELVWPFVTTVDHTLLDLADRQRIDDAVATIARAVADERTTPGLLAARLQERSRHRHRVQLLDLLGIVAGGAESILEVRYVRDVERAHRLPVSVGQQPGEGIDARHDRAYRGQRLLVELDGRLGHEGWGRSRDAGRDRRAAGHGWLTARAGWWDVTVTPCQLAGELGEILRDRGWRGWPRGCRRRACGLR